MLCITGLHSWMSTGRFLCDAVYGKEEVAFIIFCLQEVPATALLQIGTFYSSKKFLTGHVNSSFRLTSGRYETPVAIYQSTLRKFPEERISHKYTPRRKPEITY
jgi:hypothetical protein